MSTIEWTDERLEALYRRAADGDDAAAIADALGLRRDLVAAKMERLRIRVAPKPSATVTAREVGAPVGAAGWTEERRGRLADLVREGVSNGAIADALGVTRGAVAGAIDRLGLRGGGRAARAPRAAARAAPARETPVRAARPDAPRRVAPVRVEIPASARRRPTDPGRPDPALSVLFLDRRDGQCAVILDETAPILERRCCGAPVSGVDFQFCAHHRLRFTVVPGRAAA